MKNILIKVAIVALSVSATASFAGDSSSYDAEVKKDIESFQNYFKNKFPKVDDAEYANGVYAIDQASREQWEEIEEFPPYEIAIDKGEALFNTPFANGKGYKNCFDNGGIGINQQFPHFDTERKEIITLELAINECRTSNGEKKLKYKKGDIAAISAYMAFTSRGNKIDVKVPNKDAYDAYMSGKKFFYAKRGQLNFSCADCHMRIAGAGRLRADLTSPALGHTTGFPVFRSKWGSLGTLHRRYGGCNKNVRQLPFKAQSTEYRELEYFQNIMNNGLELNGPSARK